MSDKLISCAIHDYIEIACMYHFKVNLTLQDNTTFQGIAKTTKTSTDKNEYLILKQEDKFTSIELGRIKIMQSLTKNPHFDTVNF